MVRYIIYIGSVFSFFYFSVLPVNFLSIDTWQSPRDTMKKIICMYVLSTCMSTYVETSSSFRQEDIIWCTHPDIHEDVGKKKKKNYDIKGMIVYLYNMYEYSSV